MTDKAKKKRVMEIFRKGDLVKVNNLDVTKATLGTNIEMRGMVGKEFGIEDKYYDHKIRLTNPATQRRWTFAVEDLTLIIRAKDIVSEAMPKTAMFDPKDLNL